MPLFGLVRRVLAQAQNKRLLKRMGDKYADIRLSGATQRASQCSSHASPVARRTTSPSQNSTATPPPSHRRDARRASNNSDSQSQSRLSVSVCVVVPVQSAEALWIDKLRAQEESYRRSVSGASDMGSRRRCESVDDAFELWDYVCPQLVRPRTANEWV